MKYFLIATVIFCLASCKKESKKVCFKVKFIEGICGTNVYQIIDSNYITLGENNWLSSSGVIYNHVFLQENPCRNIAFAPDKTANVYIDNSNSDGCIICTATISVPPPTKRLNIDMCN
jgi:hypothetical protein